MSRSFWEGCFLLDFLSIQNRAQICTLHTVQGRLGGGQTSSINTHGLACRTESYCTPYLWWAKLRAEFATARLWSGNRASWRLLHQDAPFHARPAERSRLRERSFRREVEQEGLMSCAARQKGLCLGIASIPCLTLQLSLSSPFPVPRLMMWRRHEAVMRCHGGGAPRVSQPLDARPTRIGSPPHSWLLGSPRSTSLASPSWMVEHLLPPSQKGSKSGAAPAQKGSDGPRPTGRELRPVARAPIDALGAVTRFHSMRLQHVGTAQVRCSMPSGQHVA